MELPTVNLKSTCAVRTAYEETGWGRDCDFETDKLCNRRKRQ